MENRESQITTLKPNEKIPKLQQSTQGCGHWKHVGNIQVLAFQYSEHYFTVMYKIQRYREKRKILEEQKVGSRKRWPTRSALLSENLPGGEHWAGYSSLEACHEQMHTHPKTWGPLKQCQVLWQVWW